MTRYKLIRETLHLSKPFVSNYTKIKEDKLNSIEYGLIIPTEDEMNTLCQFYGVNQEYLQYTDENVDPFLLDNGITENDMNKLSIQDKRQLLGAIELRTEILKQKENETDFEKE